MPSLSLDFTQQHMPLDFLSSISSNQQFLVRGLFRAAARRRGVKPAGVLAEVIRDLTKRVLRALGEAEGIAYASSLCAIRDNRQQALLLAAAFLSTNGGR